MAKSPHRQNLVIEFKREKQRDHAADASAVASQMDAIATMVKDLRNEYAKDKEFLVNTRPFKKGSLVVIIEIILVDDESLLSEPPFFELVRRYLKAFIDTRIRVGISEFVVEDGNVIVLDGERIRVEERVLEMLKPNSNQSRLFQRAFERAESDPQISAIEYRADDELKPITRITRDLFARFRTSIPEEKIVAPAFKTTKETLTIRSVAFDPGLSWHFIWEGRPITAVIEHADFLERVAAGREIFRSGDRLVVDLKRYQEYDTTARTHVDKRFAVERVIEHLEATTTNRLFP